MNIQKWNYETHKYDKLTEGEMLDRKYIKQNIDAEHPNCQCMNCLKKIDGWNTGYTSHQWQSQFGLGYIVCEECHKAEMEKRYAKDN